MVDVEAVTPRTARSAADPQLHRRNELPCDQLPGQRSGLSGLRGGQFTNGSARKIVAAMKQEAPRRVKNALDIDHAVDRAAVQVSPIAVATAKGINDRRTRADVRDDLANCWLVAVHVNSGVVSRSGAVNVSDTRHAGAVAISFVTRAR